MILEAITRTLAHHKRAHVGRTGDLCTCGQLNAPGDHDRHVARKIIDAINDLAGDDAVPLSPPEDCVCGCVFDGQRVSECMNVARGATGSRGA